jgi:hypothetical protein
LINYLLAFNTVTALDPSGEVPETIVPPVPTAAGPSTSTSINV